MNIGENIRTIRNLRRITIAELCAGTGLSKGFVSQVENGKTSPSIATLQTIADFLKVPLPYLLLAPDQKMKVIKKEERTISEFGSNHIRMEQLTTHQSEGLRMMIGHLPPGASTGDEKHAHEGEEVHLVLQGKVLAEQGEDKVILEEGDCFYWLASIPHMVTNIGDIEAKILISVYSTTATNAIQCPK
ncbi:helix-turn-helix domain-containing protein [Microbacteriaceae bacterium 4G12]